MGSSVEHPRVAVLNVTAGGAKVGWNLLAQSVADMRPGGFIGIDTEFSGLASPSRMEDVDLAVRYESLRDLASQRAVLSFGVSLFNPVSMDDKGDAGAGKYEVTNLDFLLKCKDFSITADTGAFLVEHGFDFNAMFMHGILYERASDDRDQKKGVPSEGGAFKWGPYPRGLLWRLGRAGVPLVVHNGLMDLVLLYSSFHGALPKTLGEFVCVILDALPAGVYDTKLCAMGPGAEARTFLSYVYARAVIARCVHVRERANLPPQSETRPVQVKVVCSSEKRNDKLCHFYSANGSCGRRASCSLVHDAFAVVKGIEDGSVPRDTKVDRRFAKKQRNEQAKGNEVVRQKLNKKAKKRLRALEKEQADAKVCEAVEDDTSAKRVRLVETKSESLDINSKPNSQSLKKPAECDKENSLGKKDADTESTSEHVAAIASAHSAGWDAFCTAYSFAFYKNKLSDDELLGLHNRVRMPGKGRSLWLRKSQFLDGSGVTLAIKQPQDADTACNGKKKQKGNNAIM